MKEEKFEYLLSNFGKTLKPLINKTIDKIGCDSRLKNVVEDFISKPGKMIRPAVCYYSFIGSGGNRNSTEILDLSIALELLHSFLLIHDDIMDNASTRRGNKTIHEDFKYLHSKLKMVGDSSHFGVSSAILAGDLVFSLSCAIFNDLLLVTTPKVAKRLNDTYLKTIFEVITGQYLEIELSSLRSLKEVTEDEILRILEMKSGNYSLEKPMLLGAILAGKEDDFLYNVSLAGKFMGIGFQLVDDLIGLFGEPTKTGKSNRTDIEEGKITLLVYNTINSTLLSAEEKQFILESLGKKLNDEEFLKFKTLVERSGSKEKVEYVKSSYLNKAKSIIAGLHLQSPADKFFEGLVEFLDKRDR